MKKIKMIVSAAVVFAIVGGALAFKDPAASAFKCVNVAGTFKCQFVASNVQRGGSIILPLGTISTTNLNGQTCNGGAPNNGICNEVNFHYEAESN